MSVGSVLLQPQRLARTQAADDATGSELSDAATLLASIAYDAIKGGQVAETLETAFEGFGEQLLAQAESGFSTATTRLATLVEKPLDALHAKAQSFESVDGPDAALAAAQGLVGAITGLAESLTIDHIRATLTEVLDIVETNLGLTPNVLEQQVWALVDDLVDKLEHVAPESDVALRRNRLRIIGALRRLRRRLFDEFHFPQLDVEQLAEDIFALIQRSGLSDAAARVACVGAGVGTVAQSTRDLLHAVPFTGLLPSVGAGVTPDATSDERYQWYPSWLANNHRPFLVDLAMLIPDDEVVITSTGEVLQRNRLRADNSIATNVQNWKDCRKIGDDPGEYSFGLIDADTMETIAWVSSIAANGFEMLFHLLSLEEGDYVSNIVNAVGGAGYGTWKAVKKKPFPWYIEGPVVRGGGTFAASFEGVHTKASFSNCFMMWLTLAGPDYAEMLTYKYLTGAVRNLVLSTLTLMNHVPPQSGSDVHPRNRGEFDGVRHACMIGFINLYLLAFQRQDWGIMKAGDMAPLGVDLGLWTFLGGIAVGGVGGVLGSLLGSAIARDVDGTALLHKLWWGIPQAWGTTMYWLYLQQEGSTSGGTYTPFTGAAFTGYPPKASSPYLLPYDSSAVGSCYVGQANQGFWSHNLGNVGQVYAYDFSLDQDSEVLCARPGVVVAYSECMPNDSDTPSATMRATLATAIAAGSSPNTIDVDSTTGFLAPGILILPSGDLAFFQGISGNTFTGVTWRGGTCTNAHDTTTRVSQKQYGWNFVAVRHMPQDAVHDKGLGGVVGGTIAVYGHGRTGSVGKAFGRHTTPVPPEAIIGTVLKQGMPIMDAGDTGVSFHNHLHMHVIPDPNPGGTPGDGYFESFNGLDFTAPAPLTIPFVFADSDVGNGGVPTHFNWYTSSNPRTLA